MNLNNQTLVNVSYLKYNIRFVHECVSMQIRFFFYSLQDTTGKLSAYSRTLHSGKDDAVLWLGTHSDNYNWQRAHVTFSSRVKCKVSVATAHMI